MTPKRTPRMSRGKRIAAIALAVIAGIAAVGGLVWLVLVARGPAEPPKQATIEPAQETTSGAEPSTQPTTGSEATASASPTTPATPGGTASPFKRAARIAYRLGATLYIANEDGSAPAPVAKVADGAYALSPDGLTLAAISGSRLKLIDTGSGASVDAGPALDQRPVWMPDSSAVLAYRRKGHEDQLRRISRDGEKDVLLADGFAASVSPNGRVITALPSGVASSPGRVLVSVNGGKFRSVTFGDDNVTAVAAGDTRIYVAQYGSDTAEGTTRAFIVSARPDGTGAERIAEEPSGDVPAVWGGLCLSPNGTHLGAVALGDDEYSRVTILALPRGEATRLSLRRDGYARCWNSDGRYFYYLEGNAYQGEPTVLYRVEPDGIGRRAIATGAE